LTKLLLKIQASRAYLVVTNLMPFEKSSIIPRNSMYRRPDRISLDSSVLPIKNASSDSKRRLTPLTSCFFLLTLFTIVSGCNSTTVRKPEQSSPSLVTDHPTSRLTFVQWTDPHVFDAGAGRHGEAIYEEALDNWSALHWSVLETNRLVLSEGRTIEFVAITGDFGLNNVEFPNVEGTAGGKCNCPKRIPGQEGPVEQISLDRAAAEFATVLSALVVKKVYLVPGESDLCREDVRDLHRWAEFVSTVQAQMTKIRDSRRVSLQESWKGSSNQVVPFDLPQVEDLTYTAAHLYEKRDPRILQYFRDKNPPDRVPSRPITINGISILGLNSAYFGQKDDKLSTALAVEASTSEMESVRKWIQPGGSYLIFTHMPELRISSRNSTSSETLTNTFLKHAGGKTDPPSPVALDGIVMPGDLTAPTTNSSWRISKRAQELWSNEVLHRTELIGVFAGHIHSPKRETYPHNLGVNLGWDRETIDKTWVAPPLALKDQWMLPPEKSARGMLLVTVTSDGGINASAKTGDVITPIPVWFSMLDQASAAEGDAEITAARAYELDGKWDLAAEKYAGAFRSSDSRVRATATRGYVRDHAITRTWWWESGYYFPPVRWLFVHPRRTELALPALLLLLLVLRLLRQFKIFSLLGLLFKFLIVPPFRGKAIVNPPVAITKGAPADEFGAQIQAATEEIRQRLLREQENWAARQIALLSPSSASLDQVVASIPNVEKVNVGTWLKFVFKVMQLFRWSVDCGLAVFAEPSQPTGNLSSTAPRRGQLSGYAVLQWSFFIKNSWRQNVALEKPTSQVDLARNLAASILGEAFARRRW
jgi:hypothetical protein